MQRAKLLHTPPHQETRKGFVIFLMLTALQWSRPSGWEEVLMYWDDTSSESSEQWVGLCVLAARKSTASLERGYFLQNSALVLMHFYLVYMLLCQCMWEDSSGTTILCRKLTSGWLKYFSRHGSSLVVLCSGRHKSHLNNTFMMSS